MKLLYGKKTWYVPEQSRQPSGPKLASVQFYGRVNYITIESELLDSRPSKMKEVRPKLV